VLSDEEATVRELVRQSEQVMWVSFGKDGLLTECAGGVSAGADADRQDAGRGQAVSAGNQGVRLYLLSLPLSLPVSASFDLSLSLSLPVSASFDLSLSL
jgi:hypothetical protein